MLEPVSKSELIEVLRDAGAEGSVLRLRGGGSLDGQLAGAHAVLSLRRLQGNIDHDPQELVVSADAGTPVRKIEEQLSACGQMLAFEPLDHGALFGKPPGGATIGGLVATNSAGPRRLRAGSVRDHCIGIAAVSGTGEAFHSGGRVVKNVSGFDMSRLMTGSWGAWAALTRITLRCVPAPPCTASFVMRGLTPAAAAARMSAAMGDEHELTGCCHLPDAALARLPELGTDNAAATVFRIEGFEASVAERGAALCAQLGRDGDIQPLDPDQAASFWRALREMRQVPESADASLWQISVATTRVVALLGELRERTRYWMMDQAGSRLWLLATPSGDDEIGMHTVAMRHDAEACCIRPCAAEQEPLFGRRGTALDALYRRVKAAFDPEGVLFDRRQAAADKP